ncbi:MAG TPA: S-layer homology domain-containing protein, partial [Chloroflexia bacterium]|nr:S-layer homology domain-containing protein [Chloroflexia bacterium]
VSPSGATSYPAGNVVAYSAAPAAGQVFLGWTLDGVYVGYHSPLTFTVHANHTLVGRFAARPSFTDVPTSDPDYQAITFLAALGVVNPAGVNGSGQFQPDRDVLRAEMAAFVARDFGWQTEFHANAFPDKCDPQGQACVDDELWNNVAALADYGVVGGYTDAPTCASAGTTTPCYLPRDPVKRVQVLSIIARSFIKTPDLRPTGFWDRLDANLAQYTNVPNEGTQRSDLTTYRTNAGPIPGQASDTTFPDPEGNGLRRFVIEALYQAFVAQFGTDHVP